MENSILTTVRWQNAEVYRPEQYQESIIYINDENYIRVYFKLVEYYRKIDLDVANDYERFYNEIINEEE